MELIQEVDLKFPELKNDLIVQSLLRLLSEIELADSGHHAVEEEEDVFGFPWTLRRRSSFP